MVAVDTFRARAVERGPGTPIGAKLRLRGPVRTDGTARVKLPAQQLHLRAPAISGGNVNVTVPSGDTFWDGLDNANVADALKTDVTAAINAYLLALPNGSTVTWKPGVYRIDGTILQYQRHFFTHIGTGVTLRQPVHGTINDGIIFGGTHFRSPSCRFTARMVGATLEAASTAIIPAGTTITAIEDVHTVTLSQTCTNGHVAAAELNADVAGGRNRYFFDFSLGNDFILRDFTAIGANPAAGTGDEAFDVRYEAQHFVVSNGADNVEADNCTVTDIYGDFVYFTTYRGVGTNLSLGGWIHDCTFDRNGRQGCSLQGVDGFRFNNNTVSNSRRSMFDFEPNGENQINRNVEIDHNEFNAHRLLFIAASGGTRHTEQSFINIHHNTGTSPFNVEWHGQPYVDAATTAALPACTYSAVGTPRLTANANGALPAQDGQTLDDDERLLVKNQVLSQHDGPYLVLDKGSVSTPWILQRATDFSSANTLFEGSFLYVLTGSVNANSGYKLHIAGPMVLGTTPQAWSHMPGTGIGTGPWAMTRHHWNFDDNETTASFGNAANCLMQMRYVRDVHATGNTHPLQDSGMVLIDFNKCKGTNVVSGNTVAPGGQSRVH